MAVVASYVNIPSPTSTSSKHALGSIISQNHLSDRQTVRMTDGCVYFYLSNEKLCDKK